MLAHPLLWPSNCLLFQGLWFRFFVLLFLGGSRCRCLVSIRFRVLAVVGITAARAFFNPDVALHVQVYFVLKREKRVCFPSRMCGVLAPSNGKRSRRRNFRFSVFMFAASGFVSKPFVLPHVIIDAPSVGHGVAFLFGSMSGGFVIALVCSMLSESRPLMQMACFMRWFCPGTNYT